MKNLLNELLKKSNLENFKEQLHDALEEWPDMIFAIDKEKKIVFANKEFLNLTGFNKSELLNKDIKSTNLFSEDDANELTLFIHRARDKHKILEIKTKSDNKISVGVSFWELSANKEEYYFYLIKSRSEEENIEKSLNSAHMGMYKMDKDGVIYDMDIGAFNLFELNGIYDSVEELKGKKIHNIIAKYSGSKELLNNLSKINDEPYVIETEVKTLKGSKKRILKNYISNYNPEEKKQLFEVLIKDVTELKLSEEELEKKNSLYKTLFNIAPIGIILINKDGIIAEFNSYLVKLMGAPNVDEYLNKNIFSYVDFREINLLDDIKQVLEEGKPVTNKKNYVSAYGKNIVFNYVFIPVKSKNEITGAFGIIEDETKMRS